MYTNFIHTHTRIHKKMYIHTPVYLNRRGNGLVEGVHLGGKLDRLGVGGIDLGADHLLQLLG